MTLYGMTFLHSPDEEREHDENFDEDDGDDSSEEAGSDLISISSSDLLHDVLSHVRDTDGEPAWSDRSPTTWGGDDVMKVLISLCRVLGQEPALAGLENFNDLTGSSMVELSEEDLNRRNRQYGSIIYRLVQTARYMHSGPPLQRRFDNHHLDNDGNTVSLLPRGHIRAEQHRSHGPDSLNPHRPLISRSGRQSQHPRYQMYRQPLRLTVPPPELFHPPISSSEVTPDEQPSSSPSWPAYHPPGSPRTIQPSHPFLHPMDQTDDDDQGDVSDSDRSTPTPSFPAGEGSATTASIPQISQSHRPGRVSRGRRFFPHGHRRKRLWEFVRDLVVEGGHEDIIRWEDKELRIFRIVSSAKIAEMWGNHRGNYGMTYDKMSRAMRYYYKHGIFIPVLGRRLIYKFGKRALAAVTV